MRARPPSRYGSQVLNERVPIWLLASYLTFLVGAETWTTVP